ncbi:hypothetical protein ACLOJK_031267 [Asimina triloba]
MGIWNPRGSPSTMIVRIGGQRAWDLGGPIMIAAKEILRQVGLGWEASRWCAGAPKCLFSERVVFIEQLGRIDFYRGLEDHAIIRAVGIIGMATHVWRPWCGETRHHQEIQGKSRMQPTKRGGREGGREGRGHFISGRSGIARAVTERSVVNQISEIE